jgi:hypothetical protein
MPHTGLRRFTTRNAHEAGAIDRAHTLSANSWAG